MLVLHLRLSSKRIGNIRCSYPSSRARMTPEVSRSCKRCMITMIALSELFTRDGTASRKVVSTECSAASENASATLKGSSMMMRSPRLPVRLRKAMDSRKPVAVFSNFVFAFWSPQSSTPHRS